MFNENFMKCNVGLFHFLLLPFRLMGLLPCQQPLPVFGLILVHSLNIHRLVSQCQTEIYGSSGHVTPSILGILPLFSVYINPF